MFTNQSRIALNDSKFCVDLNTTRQDKVAELSDCTAIKLDIFKSKERFRYFIFIVLLFESFN